MVAWNDVHGQVHAAAATRTSTFHAYGYAVSRPMVEVLKRAGDDLTRENIMKQAASLKGVEMPMLLPGIKINTSATDFYPIQSVQLARFKGETFELFGDILSNESAEPVTSTLETRCGRRGHPGGRTLRGSEQ